MTKRKDPQKRVKEIVLYNTFSEDLSGNEKELTSFKHRAYKDEETIALFEKAKPVSGNFIWKGSIVGSVIYESGDTSRIKISRYGGFFKMVSNNQYFSFPTNELSQEWKNLINSFLSERHSN